MSADLTALSPANEGMHRNIDERYENLGVNPYLLPHNDTELDPIHCLTVLRHEFDSIHSGAKSVSVNSIAHHFDAPGRSFLARRLAILGEFHGSWRLGTFHKGHMQLANPEYMHPKHFPEDSVVSDDETRVQLIKRAAAYGILSPSDLAPRFGVDPEAVHDLIQEYGIDWRSRRHVGLQRFANTVMTLVDWGYHRTEIGDAFGFPRSGLNEIITDYADPAFSPPPKQLP